MSTDKKANASGRTGPIAHDLGKIRVGRLPTINQDEYPGLSGWWVQLRIGEDGEEVLARVYGNTPEQAHSRATALAGQPSQALTQQTLDDVMAGIPERDAEIETLRKENAELREQLEAIGAGGVNGKLMPGAVSAEPVSQYFSRVDGCQAPKATDTQCICWHDKGTGPYPDARVGDIYNGVTLTWRAKQTAPVATQAQLGEDIIVNCPDNVYTLPLRSSGLTQGPRFVVHVPAQTSASAELECSHCGGTGDVSGEYPGVACPACGGTGKAAPVADQAQPGCIDRNLLRELVDVVWNEATESTAVPDKPWADRLIDKVFGNAQAQQPVSGAGGLQARTDALYIALEVCSAELFAQCADQPRAMRYVEQARHALALEQCARAAAGRPAQIQLQPSGNPGKLPELPDIAPTDDWDAVLDDIRRYGDACYRAGQAQQDGIRALLAERDVLRDALAGVLVDDLLPLLPAEYIAKVRAALAQQDDETGKSVSVENQGVTQQTGHHCDDACHEWRQERTPCPNGQCKVRNDADAFKYWGGKETWVRYLTDHTGLVQITARDEATCNAALNAVRNALAPGAEQQDADKVQADLLNSLIDIVDAVIASDEEGLIEHSETIIKARAAIDAARREQA